MPDLSISGLPASGALTGAEIYCFVQGGVTVRGTLNDINSFIGGAFWPLSGGSVVTGTMQTDPGMSDLFSSYNPISGYTTVMQLVAGGFYVASSDTVNNTYCNTQYLPSGLLTFSSGNNTNNAFVVLSPYGLTGNTVFTPTQPEDFIQLGYLSAVIKTKIKENFTYAGVPLTLAHTSTFMYSIFSNGLFLQEGDDYTISGTTLTIINTSVNSGDKIYTVYEY